MNALIRPSRPSWDAVADARPAIGAWEQVTGLVLPEDYRSFMLRYNGGSPYPNLFRHAWADEDGQPAESESFLEPLYDWQHAESWTRELGNRLPPQTLAIGADPGLIEIVLSLRQDDYGTIYSWVRNRGAWGDAENSYLCRQAGTFREFVDNLYDTADRMGHGHWHLPGLKHLERRLEF